MPQDAPPNGGAPGAARYAPQASSAESHTRHEGLLLYFAAVRLSERLLTSSKKVSDLCGASRT